MELRESRVETPLGTVVLAVGEQGLCALGFENMWPRLLKGLERSVPRRLYQLGSLQRHVRSIVQDIACGNHVPLRSSGS